MKSAPKQQLSLIAASTLLAGFSLASIISFTDPFSASYLTHAFFYLSLFILSLGVFTIIGLALRRWLSPQVYIISLSNSFRQALLISIFITTSFLLLALGLLYWWVELSLILLLLFIEAFLNLKA